MRTGFFISLGAVFVCDRALKLLCTGRRAVLIPGVLAVRAQWNTGAAFSLLAEHPLLISALTLLCIAGMLIYVLIRPPRPFPAVCLGLITGGALGNALDRLLYGAVLDWVDLALFPWFVFNLADAAIVIGAILLGVYILFGAKETDSHGNT